MSATIDVDGIVIRTDDALAEGRRMERLGAHVMSQMRATGSRPLGGLHARLTLTGAIAYSAWLRQQLEELRTDLALLQERISVLEEEHND